LVTAVILPWSRIGSRVGTIWVGTIWVGTIWGGTIWGRTIWGGTIWGGTIWGGTIWGGTIWGGAFWGGTFWGGTFWGRTIRSNVIWPAYQRSAVFASIGRRAERIRSRPGGIGRPRLRNRLAASGRPVFTCLAPVPIRIREPRQGLRLNWPFRG
jgi:hypothetical protein